MHRSRPPASPGDRPRPLPAQTSVSNPLADARIYRPGSALALGILVLPVVLTLGLAALALQLGHAVPIWLPVLALLWLPAAPLAWLMMQSARTTALGIAVGRPWRTWTELRWDEIQHVEQRGIFLRITGPSPIRLALMLAPGLLGEGGRLRREILMKLPPTALSVGLSREAAALVRTDGISISPDGAIEGTLVARTRVRYGAVLVLVAIALVGGSALAWMFAATPTPALAAAAGAGGLLALLCLALAAWLPQRLTLDAEGVTVTHAVGLVRGRSFRWQRLDMVEYTPRLTLLRIRGKRVRALCAGPRLFDSEQAAIAWRYLQGQCHEHDVLLIMRRRLP